MEHKIWLLDEPTQGERGSSPAWVLSSRDQTGASQNNIFGMCTIPNAESLLLGCSSYLAVLLVSAGIAFSTKAVGYWLL